MMSETVIRGLLGDAAELDRRGVRYRQGIVSAVSPLAVKVGGSTTPYTSVRALASYAPVLNDVVAVLLFGSDLLILGAIGIAGTNRGSFSAYRNAALSGIASGAHTPFVCDAEEWDLASWYDPATGRYNPKLPGKYALNAGFYLGTAVVNPCRLILGIAKNNTFFGQLQAIYVGGGDDDCIMGSRTVDANGTTDYFQPTIHHNHTAAIAARTGVSGTIFQGRLETPI